MLVTQAEFARMHDVSAVAVNKWKKRGMLAMVGNQVDAQASNEKLKRYRDSHDPRATRGKTAAGNIGVAPGKQQGSTWTQMKAAEIRAKLAALDWTQKFEWSEAEIARRVSRAAACAGMVAVQSEARDDGHWGGYQVRNLAALKQRGGPCYECIEAGYGFELDAHEVIGHCRHAFDDEFHDDDELIDVDISLLSALALPFGEAQTGPGDSGAKTAAI